MFKRKQSQVMTFRSFESLEYLCQSMGTVALLREQGQNLFESITSIFDRSDEKPTEHGLLSAITQQAN